jgi:hypothetical protein
VPSKTIKRELILDTIELNRESAQSIDSLSCFISSPYQGVPLSKISVEKGYLSPDKLADANAFTFSILKPDHI